MHALVAEHAPADWAELPSEEVAGRVVVGIETDRGPWVTALRAAGYQVFAINPLSSARYRERHSTSGAKSDAGDAHVLAEIVRLDRDHHRQIAGDTDLVDAVKLVARAHQTAIWERTRQVLRMRSTLREYFPAAVEAFEDLAAKDSLLLLARAPSPSRAAKLTRSQVVSALRAARRHHVEAKADALLAVLRAPGLRQPAITEAAYAAVVVGQVGIITALNEQIAQLQEVVAEHFGRHPAADIYLSQPGLGVVLAARALGEFGDDKKRFTRRPGPEELLRAKPHHPGLRQENHRHGAVRDQQSSRRRTARAGALRAERIARSAGLLRRAQSQEGRSSRRPTPAREPARRHPARLPENRHQVRREHGLAAPLDRRRLTQKHMGCLLSQTANGHRAGSTHPTRANPHRRQEFLRVSPPGVLRQRYGRSTQVAIPLHPIQVGFSVSRSG